ncbi:hypothetical protein GDO78_019040 [Eleutherodactylus coqui]|uniref:WD repeat domain 75 n=1 Tax=Eleutherodactylus coqui TaxID=57060 RepID=A0A8J6BLA0_ELECQ|nr:hypothetical protein GDO78_019040 [Eleutherodactylus coqui]
MALPHFRCLALGASAIPVSPHVFSAEPRGRMVTDGEVRVLQSGGSRINLRRALFSKDGKYLLCVSGDAIKVFSTATDECLHALWSHRDLVTGIQLYPNNPLQLLSCSLDGTIKLWDFLDGIVIKTFLIERRLFGLYTSASADCVYAICQGGSSTRRFDLISIKLPKSTAQECKATQVTVLFTDVHSSHKCTAVGREGEYIVTARRHTLIVYFLKSKETFR